MKDTSRGIIVIANIEHAVRETIAAYVGKASQFDDMTMLCLRYQGKEGSI